jgi:hypothetical protein
MQLHMLRCSEGLQYFDRHGKVALVIVVGGDYVYEVEKSDGDAVICTAA